MKIKTFGAKHFTGQLPRIEEGFKELGHEILDDSSPYNADLIYVNDAAHFDEALEWFGACSAYVPRIFNVLDIPEHLIPNYDLQKLDEQLAQATHITCISNTTRKQLKKFLGIQGVAKIYQPSMPVYQTNCRTLQQFDHKFLIIGRNNDPNKRNILAYQYLHKYDPEATVAILGSEHPGFGDYFGVVPIPILNDLYNSVDYVFSLTKYGGIELSQIEAILAGKFPIVCKDSDVAIEFNPEFACDPTPEGINKKIIEIEQNPTIFKEIVKQKQQVFSKWFDKTEVARKILALVE